MPPRIGAILPRRTPIVSPDEAQRRSGVQSHKQRTFGSTPVPGSPLRGVRGGKEGIRIRGVSEACLERSRRGAEHSGKLQKLLPITSLFSLTSRFLSPISVPVSARNAPGALRGRLFPPIPTADPPAVSGMVFSAKGGARPRRYTSPSSEGEARTRIGVGVQRRPYPLRGALRRKATPPAGRNTPIPSAALRDFPR